MNRDQLQEALAHWQQLQSEHAGGIDFLKGMRLLAGAQLDGGEDSVDVTADWASVTAGDWLHETLEQIRDPSGVVGCSPGDGLNATLRPYQVDGVRWLWFMTRLGLGACLADDMGLGKTIQVIDLLLRLGGGCISRPSVPADGCETHPPRSSLLIVPASLVGNWKQELARFAPQLQCFFAHRSECEAEALDRIAKRPHEELADFDLVVTTYTMARKADWVAKMKWKLVVLDEAQAIKNASSAQTKAVKKLDAAGRIALTGTPVENHLGDLWSLFDFCCPGLLGSAKQFKSFVKQLNKQQDVHAYGALRRLVRPYILRRMKTDPNIVPDLPDKMEMRADCGLSKKQAALYEQLVDDLARQLKKAKDARESGESNDMQRRGLVLSMLMKLKQVCNHPSQLLAQPDFVAGSETYTITIDIAGLSKETWTKIKQDCSVSIDSLLDLLAGRFSDGVMQRLTRQKKGLFPSPGEIKMKCSCPDYSYCCKHLAAVMYGVGSRLDKQPELLFVLRNVDHQELVSQAFAEGNLEKELTGGDGSLAGEDLGAIFGIDPGYGVREVTVNKSSINRRSIDNSQEIEKENETSDVHQTGDESAGSACRQEGGSQEGGREESSQGGRQDHRQAARGKEEVVGHVAGETNAEMEVGEIKSLHLMIQPTENDQDNTLSRFAIG